MTDALAYLWLLVAGGGSITLICYSLSRRNAYRDDGIDNLGGVLRRWADRRVAVHRSLPQGTDDGLIYYGYSGRTAWAFKTAEELGEWASEHPEGTFDVQVREP